MKIAPVGILSSADKWAVDTTWAIGLFSLTACTTVQTLQVVAAWANFEALSSRTD